MKIITIIFINIILNLNILCPNNPPYCFTYLDNNNKIIYDGILIKYYEYFYNNHSIIFDNKEKNKVYDIIIDFNNKNIDLNKYNIEKQIKNNFNILLYNNLDYKLLGEFLINFLYLAIVLLFVTIIIFYFERKTKNPDIKLDFAFIFYFINLTIQFLFLKININFKSKYSIIIILLAFITMVYNFQFWIYKILEKIYVSGNYINIFNFYQIKDNSLLIGDYFNNKIKNKFILNSTNYMNMEKYFINSGQKYIIIENNWFEKLKILNQINYLKSNFNYIFSYTTLYYKKTMNSNFNINLYKIFEKNFNFYNSYENKVSSDFNFNELYIWPVYIFLLIIILLVYFIKIYKTKYYNKSDLNFYINSKYKLKLIKNDIKLKYNEEFYTAISNILKIYYKKNLENYIILIDKLKHWNNN